MIQLILVILGIQAISFIFLAASLIVIRSELSRIRSLVDAAVYKYTGRD